MYLVAIKELNAHKKTIITCFWPFIHNTYLILLGMSITPVQFRQSWLFKKCYTFLVYVKDFLQLRWNHEDRQVLLTISVRFIFELLYRSKCWYSLGKHQTFLCFFKTDIKSIFKCMARTFKAPGKPVMYIPVKCTTFWSNLRCSFVVYRGFSFIHFY